MADDNIELGLSLAIKDFVSNFKEAGKVATDEIKKINQEINETVGVLSGEKPFSVKINWPKKELDTAVEQISEVTRLTEEEIQKEEDAFNRLKETAKKSFEEIEDSGIESNKNLGENFDGVNVTVNDLLERLDDLKGKLKSATIGSEEYTRWAGEIRIVEGELKKANLALRDNTTQVKTGSVGTGAFRTVLLETTGALRQIHPALGEVVSNLNPMISGFNTASVRGMGLKDMLRTIIPQMIGPLSLGAAAGVLGYIITSLGNKKDEAAKKTKQYADEIKNLRTEVEKMSKETLRLALSEVMLEQSRLVSEVVKSGGVLTEEQNKQAESLKNQEKVLKERLATIGDLTALENERLEIEKNIQGLRNIDATQGPLSPGNLKKLEDYNQRLKEIEKTTKGISGKDKNDKKLKPLFDIETDAELLKQLDFINNKLKDISLSEREIAEWKKLQLEINEKLYGPTGKSRELKPRLNTGESDARLVNPFDDGLAGSTKEELKQLAEKNKLLREQKTTWQEMREVVRDAGKSMISAWTSSFNLIKRNQTMLEQFINGLARAIAEALALKAITSIFNVVTSILSAGSGAATAVPSGPGGGGGIFTKPVGGGFNYASAVATRGNTYSGGGSFVREVPYIAETRASGRDLKIIIKRQDEFNKDYR